MQSTRYSCQILMMLEFSRQTFEKYLNIRFYENPFIVSQVVPRGQIDRQDEANNHFWQFCKRS